MSGPPRSSTVAGAPPAAQPRPSAPHPDSGPGASQLASSRPAPHGQPDARVRSASGPAGAGGARGPVSGDRTREGQRQRDHVPLALPEAGVTGVSEGQRRRDHAPGALGAAVGSSAGWTGSDEAVSAVDDVNATDRFSALPDGKGGSDGGGSRSARSTDSGEDARSGSASARRRTSRARPAVTALSLLMVIVVMVVGFSIGRAVAVPSSASVQSRVGDWARDHNLTFFIEGVDRFR